MNGLVLALWDDTTQQIIALTAALMGLGWVYVNILRPAARGARRFYLLMESLEDLPGMNERIAALEGEMGRAQARQKVIHNGQRAIIRELALEDSVRRISEEQDTALWEDGLSEAP